MTLNERYNFTEIEKKWQERWREARLFRAEYSADKPKLYGLVMFPYPSGSGLSVGHFKNYVPLDAYLRYKAMCGYNVIHPMGWDAFGQPAENEAIKTVRNPKDMVPEYAANYRKQLDIVGLSYDWDREINSSDPGYYKWTQWIFLELFKRGLAYRASAPVNWCPVDKTVLANEEVANGRCWRCKTLVERRQMPQWFFRITAYAEQLLTGLDKIDWPEGVKAMQRNWIGRSEGAEVDFAVPGEEQALRVFTTRPDTLWGATFMVVAPEHPIVARITTVEQKGAVDAYVLRASRTSEIDRAAEGKEKTGVWTGAYAVNPVNGENIPIWIADYVMMGYGTGAIMAVPAHDQRDFDFARKFGLPIVPVYQKPGERVAGDEMTEAAIGGGVAVIGPFAGEPDNYTTVGKVIRHLEAEGLGTGVVKYKLRDWLISRQRYWGAPIPIVHCPVHGEVAVPDDQLPVELPDVESYQPTGTGEGPLAAIPEFINTTCPTCGGPARREADTMGGFACSSWYFLRFADPHNDEEAWSKKAVDYWLPVDLYVGGKEHAVMHLLYARFWTKALHDAGYLSFDEPFKQLRNQGTVLAYTPGLKLGTGESADGEDGGDESIEDWKALPPYEVAQYPANMIEHRWVKMSKSVKNVVTPDAVAANYGADSLRVYELFVAPFEDNVQWSDEGIRGSSKFLARFWRVAALYSDGFKEFDWRRKIAGVSGKEKDLRRKTHQTIAKVADDLENFRFNTAVSAMMEMLNLVYEVVNVLPAGERSAAVDEAIETMTKIIAPIAPHIADEIWEAIGGEGFLYRTAWPKVDAAAAVADEITLVIQVNGKVRDKLVVPADTDNATLEALALASPKVIEHLQGRQPKKVIVVPGKLVNVVG